MRAYTDGSTFPKNPGLGGIAFVAYGHKHHLIKSEHIPSNITNNRAEALATLKLLDFSKDFGIKEIEVFTDSQYTFFGLRRVLDGKDLLDTHKDLWEDIKTLTTNYNIVIPVLVRGHSGLAGNEVADCLAYLAASNTEVVYEYIAKEDFESFRKAIIGKKKEARIRNKKDC